MKKRRENLAQLCKKKFFFHFYAIWRKVFFFSILFCIVSSLFNIRKKSIEFPSRQLNKKALYSTTEVELEENREEQKGEIKLKVAND